MKENIINRNNKDEVHGYCIQYTYNQLINYYIIEFRGTYKNNQQIGYIENHRYNKETTYHII